MGVRFQITWPSSLRGCESFIERCVLNSSRCLPGIAYVWLSVQNSRHSAFSPTTQPGLIDSDSSPAVPLAAVLPDGLYSPDLGICHRPCREGSGFPRGVPAGYQLWANYRQLVHQAGSMTPKEKKKSQLKLSCR